jgi:hypothetical protein
MNAKEEPERQVLHQAIHCLMHYFKTLVPVPDERRRQARMPFIHPITVVMADGRRLGCLSRDVSLDGLRLLGNERLVGQTVRVVIQPTTMESAPWCFTLQVLWSSVIGDGLVDSGGRLVEVVDGRVE